MNKQSKFKAAAGASQRGMTLLEIMIVLAIIAIVMGILIGPRVLQMFKDAKKETAGIMAVQFAFQGYTQWSMNNDEECPSSLKELTRYMNKKDTKDPWDGEFVMLCGDQAPEAANGFGVLSKGPDGKQGSPDDIKSWERKKKRKKKK